MRRNVPSLAVLESSTDSHHRLPLIEIENALRYSLGDAQSNAAIGLAPFDGAVVPHWMISAVGLGVQARGINAEADKLSHHDVRAILRQLEVRRWVALRECRAESDNRYALAASAQIFAHLSAALGQVPHLQTH